MQIVDSRLARWVADGGGRNKGKIAGGIEFNLRDGKLFFLLDGACADL